MKTVTKILAWDYSGSTANVAHYHNIGKQYVEEFRAGVADDTVVKYLLWGDADFHCVEVTAERLDNVILKREGKVGTYPSTIINWIQENIDLDKTRVELWLITDGEIERYELRKCARLNQSMTYDLVKFIIINRGHIDMSVGASFISGTSVEIYTNEQKYKTINTAIPFDYTSITIDNFQEKWPDLTDFIQAKFMGSDRDALEESEKLGSLRKRLLAAVAKRDAENEKEASVVTKFKSKKKEDLIRDLKECDFYRNLTNTQLKDERTQIDGMVSSLVNYIHNKHKSFDFNGIKLDFKTEQMEEIDDEPEIDKLVDVEECKFYDCVTLEEELAQPILLLPITDLIQKYWENGSYSKFRPIIDCPFFASVDECIGHVYSLETFKSLREHAESSCERLVNPMTNEEIFGGLIFSTSTEADAWNDYVLAHTFFRGKKVCPDFSLWYFVIWKHCQNKEWIEKEVVKKLGEYAFRRLENCKVRLAFSSLPLDPQERVPVPVACFYCTEGSSTLFGQNKKLFAHERLRMFSGVANQMLEILEHFGYDDVDKDFVLTRAKTLMIVNELKRIPQLSEKRYCLAKKVFKATEDGRFLTYEVKNKDALKYFQLLKLSHKEMIPVDFNSEPADLSAHVLCAYNYQNNNDVLLCAETYRPYFVVEEATSGVKVSNYKQILNCITDVKVHHNGEVEFLSSVERLNQSRLVSCSKLYIDLTNEMKRFPSLDEFKDHIAKVRKFKEQRLVFLFPPDVVEKCESNFKQYNELGVGVDVFLKKTMATVSVLDRVKMERSLDEGECEQFILEAKKLIQNTGK